MEAPQGVSRGRPGLSSLGAESGPDAALEKAPAGCPPALPGYDLYCGGKAAQGRRKAGAPAFEAVRGPSDPK
jgi:hypothetical protein